MSTATATPPGTDAEAHAAAEAGADAVVVQGFEAGPARGVRMPGPVDQRRVLLKALREGGADGLAGLVTR